MKLRGKKFGVFLTHSVLSQSNNVIALSFVFFFLFVVHLFFCPYIMIAINYVTIKIPLTFSEPFCCDGTGCTLISDDSRAANSSTAETTVVG